MLHGYYSNTPSTIAYLLLLRRAFKGLGVFTSLLSATGK